MKWSRLLAREIARRLKARISFASSADRRFNTVRVSHCRSLRLISSCLFFDPPALRSETPADFDSIFEKRVEKISSGVLQDSRSAATCFSVGGSLWVFLERQLTEQPSFHHQDVSFRIARSRKDEKKIRRPGKRCSIVGTCSWAN